MKKSNYAILGLLFVLSATAVCAQTPDLPSLDDTDEKAAKEQNSLDPLLEIPSEDTKVPDGVPALPVAQPKENKEILDKAIDEVFQEPKLEEKKPEEKAAEPVVEKKATIQIDSDNPEAAKTETTEAPDINESADPLSLDEEPVATTPVEAAKDVVPAEPNVAAGVKAPEAEPKKEEKVEAPKVEAPKEEPKVEVKAEEKPPVAPEKFVQEKKVAKPKPRKKAISLPKQTPKSLREDYREQTFDSFGNPVNTAPTPHFENLPANTKPIDGFIAPETVPVKKSVPSSMNQSQLEENDLDVLNTLPSKKKDLELKSDINIDRGDFSDPFGSAPVAAGSDNNDSLPTDAGDLSDSSFNEPVTDVSGVPVVDLSETANQDAASHSKKIEGSDSFYMQDSGLDMEVKDAPKGNLGAMKNAYEALQVGQYESAIRYYNDVLETNPNNKKALFGIATAYHMSKDYEKAKETYLKIINLDPKFWPAVNNYIILVTEENPEKSIPRLEDLYSKNPSFAAIPAQLGNLYYKKGDVQKSVNYYTTAVKLEPKNIEYRYNLALILEKTSNKQEAAALYRSLLEDAAQGQKLPENPNAIKDRYDQLLSSGAN